MLYTCKHSKTSRPEKDQLISLNMSGARVSSMNDKNQIGTEARSNREKPEQIKLDIEKVLEQCGIDPNRWQAYVNCIKN
ncbi:hypothetical protein [Paenibacillus pini]|uniref:hypothetical protein n=1 Tax=Paenibacillus pini TaxID=669461 RepID=UPI00130E340A|nr:hypothetical protein [Paenibacillus pini]